MTTDQELLRRYAQEGSQDAFTEVVSRHVDLVYGAALRQLCGNVSLAQDVTQAVFTILGSKADSLSRRRHLSAWLYTTTRFTVSHAVRTERRRQNREQKAQSMHALLADSESHDMPAVPPKLFDKALEELDEGDREAILLRFIERQPFCAIGLAMDVSEDAARMRVTRALERIRGFFAKNGITSASAAVGAALANQATAAPMNLAAHISTAALAGGAAIAATASARIGIASLMATTKATAWITGAAVIFALGYSGYQYHEAAIRENEAARLVQERNRLQDALNRSEQRSEQFRQQAAQAEQQIALLQHKLDGLPVSRPLQVRKIGPANTVEKRKLIDEKMAKMKPLLEGGVPITGAVVILIDGKAVQRQVAFVMGKETRIEGGDEGTYVITPTLNEDGSVKYAIAIRPKNADGGQEPVETRVTIIQTPWEGFEMGSNDGKTMAFDPDESGP